MYGGGKQIKREDTWRDSYHSTTASSEGNTTRWVVVVLMLPCQTMLCYHEQVEFCVMISYGWILLVEFYVISNRWDNM